jgi:hypothetical protein
MSQIQHVTRAGQRGHGIGPSRMAELGWTVWHCSSQSSAGMDKLHFYCAVMWGFMYLFLCVDRPEELSVTRLLCQVMRDVHVGLRKQHH